MSVKQCDIFCFYFQSQHLNASIQEVLHALRGMFATQTSIDDLDVDEEEDEEEEADTRNANEVRDEAIESREMEQENDVNDNDDDDDIGDFNVRRPHSA